VLSTLCELRCYYIPLCVHATPRFHSFSLPSRLHSTCHCLSRWYKDKSWQEYGGKKMLSTLYFHAPIFLPQSFRTIRVLFTVPSCNRVECLFVFTRSQQNRSPELGTNIERRKMSLVSFCLYKQQQRDVLSVRIVQQLFQPSL
jgi:hypothetical protein